MLIYFSFFPGKRLSLSWIEVGFEVLEWTDLFNLVVCLLFPRSVRNSIYKCEAENYDLEEGDTYTEDVCKVRFPRYVWHKNMSKAFSQKY
jgi:hypothetical protein